MKHRLYLTSVEIDSLLTSTLNGSFGIRNYCLVLLAFRHGMRISEALGLRIQDVDIKARRLDVKRLKNGFSTIHPLEDDEILALANWIEERSSWKGSSVSDLIFLSRNGKSLSRQQAYRIVRNSGKKAGIVIDIHPHMLRHSCGYELAERGTDTRLIQDYLGHRNIRHTIRYTASNAGRFVGLWQQKSLTQRFKTCM
ncbi:TPA: tyrosine-type DNA invertase [Klebsiella oxytoca]